MDIGDIEDRLDELASERPDEDLEIIIEDEVVRSGWEPPEGVERPETGTTRYRCFMDESGEWVSEELASDE